MILKADSQRATLLDFRYRQHYFAKKGQHGKGKNQEGRSAPDLILPVPVGTIVRDAQTGELLKDFTHEGEILIVARGGRGGRGNARFATPTLQAPRQAEPGQPGEARWILLELKLMADIGIVGFPNVGKSTLISRISAVRPKIADYPFTTLVPNLGVVRFHDYPPFVVADIPGIIKGAHEGAGLGLKFLRHVERTSLILHILDVSGTTQRDPIEDYLILNQELALFDANLAAKPQIVALNKIDLPDSPRIVKKVKSYFQQNQQKVYPISALTGQGLTALLKALVENLPPRMKEGPAN